MFLKIVVFCLLFTPVVLQCGAQVNDWTLFLDQQAIASAKEDSVQTVQVHGNKGASLRFVFAGQNKAMVRKIIVMNEQRNGIDIKKITVNAVETEFDLLELYQQSAGKDLYFYTVNTPADPAKAALVRVAPKLICHLQWIE